MHKVRNQLHRLEIRHVQRIVLGQYISHRRGGACRIVLQCAHQLFKVTHVRIHRKPKAFELALLEHGDVRKTFLEIVTDFGLHVEFVKHRVIRHDQSAQFAQGGALLQWLVDQKQQLLEQRSKHHYGTIAHLLAHVNRVSVHETVVTMGVPRRRFRVFVDDQGVAQRVDLIVLKRVHGRVRVSKDVVHMRQFLLHHAHEEHIVGVDDRLHLLQSVLRQKDLREIATVDVDTKQHRQIANILGYGHTLVQFEHLLKSVFDGHLAHRVIRESLQGVHRQKQRVVVIQNGTMLCRQIGDARFVKDGRVSFQEFLRQLRVPFPKNVQIRVFQGAIEEGS